MKEENKDDRYKSKFHRFVAQTITKETAEDLPVLMGCSPHRRTSILKRPERAVHDEVLFFAKLLNQSVIYLLDTYGLGARGMTEREIKLHRRIHEQQPEPALSE